MRYLCVFFLLAIPCLAADWDITGGVGFARYHAVTFTNSSGTANAGIGARYVLHAAVERLIGGHLGIEGAWTYQDGDFELASHGTKTAFDADSHSIHAGLLGYLRPRASRLRPFVEAGVGSKLYHGVEHPSPRPLAEFGSFRDGIDARALVLFGGGVKYRLSHRWGLRLDVCDFATPFPSSVIVPAPGVNSGGWLHDLVMTLGFTIE